MVNFGNMVRGKSFLEARSAVQRQIEKMFIEANNDDGENGVGSPCSGGGPSKHSPGIIKHTMHGVSHVSPEDEDKYCTPPPVHYGVQEALRSRRESSAVMAERLSANSPPARTESTTENFNSQRSTVVGFRSSGFDISSSNVGTVSSVGIAGSKTIVDLGNIDIMRRRMATATTSSTPSAVVASQRLSTTEESLAAQVRRRERSREEQANIRRISVHQDSFDFTTSATATDSEESIRQGATTMRRGHPLAASSPLLTSATDGEEERGIGRHLQQQQQSTSTVKKPHLQQKAKPVRYRIEYLGAVPLRTKATNLEALQVPIKELYFKHKALASLGHANLPGTLEISETGLKVQYIRELHKGVQEIFNSFPTIAVWAAVKFVHKTVVSSSGERRHKFAFVPLISDTTEEDEEGRRPFHDLDYEEVGLAQAAPHPPIFACVMRRSGQPKQLECHGFICAAPEDAIVIAANLYQSLLDTMRRHRAAGHTIGGGGESPNLRRSAFARQSSRRSMRSSGGSGDKPPVRPPRKKRPRGGDEHGAAQQPRVVTGLMRRRSMRSSTRSNRSARSGRSVVSNRRPTGGRTIQNSREEFTRQSTRRSSRARPAEGNSSIANIASTASNTANGDVFTKVTIGRTKSFVKTGNQYNLQELFRELKEKEGVDSIDDVLRRVISPDGMSFNDIKPVYRELLLKLAMTMSQDEIFERSKTIMAHSRKRQKKSAARAGDLSSGGSLGSFFKSLSSRSTNTNSSNSRLAKNSTGSLPAATKTAKLPTTAAVAKSSGGGTKPAKSIRYQSGRQITKADISSPIPLQAVSGRSQLKSKEAEAEQHDDAYVSCSECYSACTYTSCSSSCRERSRLPASKEKDEEGHLLSECDADSCISSEKCYCSLRGNPADKKASGTANANHHRPHACSIYSEVTDSGTGSQGNCVDTSCYSSSSACYSTMERGSSHSSSSSGIITSTSSTAGTSPRRHKASMAVPIAAAAANDSPLTAWKRNTEGLAAAPFQDGGETTTGSHTCCSCSLSSSSSHYSDSMAMSNSLKFNRHLPPLPSEERSGGLSAVMPPRRKISDGYRDPYSADWHHKEGGMSPVRGRTNLRDGRGSLGASSCSSASMSPSSSQSSSSPSIPSYRHHRSSSATRSPSSSISQQPPKFLLLSAVDPRGNVVYRGSAANTAQQQPQLMPTTLTSRSGGGGRYLDASQDEDNIMSLKKSAEIAAMFAGARISQTTDLVDGIQIDETYRGGGGGGGGARHRGSSQEAARSRLGYFP